MPATRRPRRRVGDVLRIPLPDGTFAFGRVCTDPLIAFYDYRGSGDIAIDDLIARPITFRVWVMNYAIRDGIWAVLGHRPLEPSLQQSPTFFKQDPLNGQLSLYLGNGQEVACGPDDCVGKERAAVWDPEHVVERLVDYFEQRPNKWVEAMKPKN